MKLGRTSFLHFASLLVSSLVSFGSTIYFANVLGAEVLGSYFLVITIMTWLSFLMGFGINTATKKRLSEGKPDSHISASVLLQFGLFLIIACVLIVFEPYFNSYVGAEVIDYILLLLVTSNVFTVVQHILEGKNLVYISGILKPTNTILRNIAQIFVVFLGLGLTGMLTGYAIGGLLAGLIGLRYVSFDFTRPTIRSVRSLISYAKYAWVGSIRSKVFSWIDLAVLGLFVTPALVGIYQVAWLLGSFFAMFGSSISRAVFPVISDLSTDESYDRVGELVTTSLSFSGLFLFPGLVGALLVGDTVLSMYGVEFRRGMEVLPLLIVAHFLYTFQDQFTNALNAINRPDLSFRINAVFIVTNAVLNFTFISQIGWFGAALASTLSAGICLLLGYLILSNLVNFSLRRPTKNVSFQLIAASLMGCLVYGMEQLLGDSIIAVVVTVATGGAAYFFILLVISDQFRQIVINNSPEYISKFLHA